MKSSSYSSSVFLERFKILLMSGVGVLLSGALAPEIGSVIDVCVRKSSIGSFNEVTSCSGLSFSLGVDVLDTGELEQFFSDWGCNKTSTSGGGDQSDLD